MYVAAGAAAGVEPKYAAPVRWEGDDAGTNPHGAIGGLPSAEGVAGQVAEVEAGLWWAPRARGGGVATP